MLKPGGQLHVADWGRPTGKLMRVLFTFIQVLDGFHTTSDNVKGLLPDIIHECGFDSVRVCCNLPTIFGTMALYSAQRPCAPEADRRNRPAVPLNRLHRSSWQLADSFLMVTVGPADPADDFPCAGGPLAAVRGFGTMIRAASRALRPAFIRFILGTGLSFKPGPFPGFRREAAAGQGPLRFTSGHSE